jgi:hypothetical protein
MGDDHQKRLEQRCYGGVFLVPRPENWYKRVYSQKVDHFVLPSESRDKASSFVFHSNFMSQLAWSGVLVEVAVCVVTCDPHVVDADLVGINDRQTRILGYPSSSFPMRDGFVVRGSSHTVRV